MPTISQNDSIYGGLNIFLQSKDAQKRDNVDSNVDFYLETIITHPRKDIGMLISVLDAEIPYSWYNISEHIGNNTLTIGDTTITLPEKNYSAFSLVDAFNQAFQSLNTPLNVVMSFNDNTNKFSLTSPNQFTLTKTTMQKELGMHDLPFTGTDYTSSKCVNLSGTSSVYIRSENMNINNINSMGRVNGVLAKILVNASPSTFIFHQPTTPQYFLLGNSLNYINIQLKNDDNQFIDLNGLDFSLTLSVEYFRRRDDFINYKYYLHSIDDKKQSTDANTLEAQK